MKTTTWIVTLSLLVALVTGCNTTGTQGVNQKSLRTLAEVATIAAVLAGEDEAAPWLIPVVSAMSGEIYPLAYEAADEYFDNRESIDYDVRLGLWILFDVSATVAESQDFENVQASITKRVEQQPANTRVQRNAKAHAVLLLSMISNRLIADYDLTLDPSDRKAQIISDIRTAIAAAALDHGVDLSVPPMPPGEQRPKEAPGLSSDDQEAFYHRYRCMCQYCHRSIPATASEEKDTSFSITSPFHPAWSR